MAKMSPAVPWSTGRLVAGEISALLLLVLLGTASCRTASERAGAMIKQLPVTEVIVSAADTPVVSVRQFGAQGTGLTDDTASFVRALATGRPVFVPAGNYQLDGTLMVPAGSSLSGVGRDTVLSFRNTTNDAVVLADGCQLTGVRVTGPYTNSLEHYAAREIFGDRSRRVVSGNRCVFRDLWIDHAGWGLEIKHRTDVAVTDYHFHRIRHFQGFASGLHVECSTNVTGLRLYGTDSDRAIEVENGSRDCRFETGAFERIRPIGYAGQPTNYPAYTFVLDAHGHRGLPRCERISYQGFDVRGCGGAISVQSDDVFVEEEINRDVQFRDVDVSDPADVADPNRGFRVVRITGRDILVENVRIHGRPSAKADVAFIDSNSDAVTLRQVRFDSFRQGAVTVETRATNTVIEHCVFGVPKEPSPWAVVSDVGADTQIRTNEFARVGHNLGPAVRLADGSRSAAVQGNRFVGDRSTTGAPAVATQGASATVDGNWFIGNGQPTIVGGPAGAGRNAGSTLIRSNVFLEFPAPAALVRLDPGTYGYVVRDNVAVGGRGRVEDLGTDNEVRDNRFSTAP